MNEIVCRYRDVVGAQAVCGIVSEFMGRPLEECHTNDSACRFCLACGIAPQAPNSVVASMAIGVAVRTRNEAFVKFTIGRFRKHLPQQPPAVTACVLRGAEIRQVACKPCQSGSKVAVLKPVFACPVHHECTLHNTGVHPRIQACATCGDRQESSTRADAGSLRAEGAGA